MATESGSEARTFTPLAASDKKQSFAEFPATNVSVGTRKLYPAIEPYETGFLPVGDGHELYYELCGEELFMVVQNFKNYHRSQINHLLFVPRECIGSSGSLPPWRSRRWLRGAHSTLLRSQFLSNRML